VRPRLAAGLGLCVLFTLTACARPAGHGCTQTADPAKAGLCFGGVTTSITNERQIAVTSLIVNASDSPIDGRVWWVLAPVGPGNPWDRAVYTSRVDAESYSSRSERRVAWDTTISLPSAFYDLALIAHRVEHDGKETHADARLIGPIHIGEPKSLPWLIRYQEASGPVSVVSTSGVLSGGPGADPSPWTATLANRGVVAVQYSLALQVRTTLAGWENKWWLGSALYIGAPIFGSLAAREVATIVVSTRPPIQLSTSLPKSQIWLLVMVGKRIEDEVMLGGPQVFISSPSPLLRRGLPSGPVELISITTANNWTHARREEVMVGVRNLTGMKQITRLLWYLAAPNDAQPWVDGVAGGAVMQLQIEPWAAQTVVIRAYQTAPIGNWELSVWAHYESGAATFTQTDVMWLPEPVVVS
jgi:hypothetical protein